MAKTRFPQKSDWKQHEEIEYAGSRGWNIMQRLPELLKEHYEELKDFEFGFPIEEDVPEYRHLGWVHLTRSMFPPDAYNQSVALRFAVDDVGGNLKWREHYIMVAPIDHRDRIREVRNSDHEVSYQRQVEGIVHDQPDHLAVVQEDSGLEEKHIKLEPDPASEDADDALLERVVADAAAKESAERKRGGPKKKT